MDTPRPASGADDQTLAAPNFANMTPTDWDVLMNRRASKRKYGQRSSSCGSGRSSVDSFLSEDFGDGSRSPSPEDAPETMASADKKKIGKQFSGPFTRNNQIDLDWPFWTRVLSDWDAKWKSMPKEDAPQHEGDPNAPEPAPQTSSSSSLSLPEEDPDALPQQKSRKKRPKSIRKSLAKTVTAAIRRTRIKRMAKKWFTQLTANFDEEESAPKQAWRQRRVAAVELFQIAEREAQGDGAVARRFTKSPTRMAIGLRAILRLCEEEEKGETGGYPEVYLRALDRDLHYSASQTSYCLMSLVMLHADRLLFLETIISGALREGIDYGHRAIHFLATSIPDFFDRVDPVVIFEYAIQAIRNSSSPMPRRTQAFELIYHSFYGSAYTEQRKAATLSTCRLILNSMVELCGEIYSEISSILRVIVRMGWVAKDKGIFPFIFSPTVLSNIIQKNPSATRIISSNIGVPDALVLKLLTLWIDELQISTIMSSEQVACLAEACMRAMCNEHSGYDQLNFRLGDSFTLHLDEDAFGILCNLPPTAFQNALKGTLYPSESGWLYFDRQSSMLDLLLWLSNMPANVSQAHHALIGGDACAFLVSILPILPDNEPLKWRWSERAEWRARGEAMTCLGNIIERMNETELRDHVPKAAIEAAVAMKENEEAPLTQRGQAIFMLQRYTVAADRCGVEPYHREEAPAPENEQERREEAQVEQVQPTETQV